MVSLSSSTIHVGLWMTPKNYYISFEIFSRHRRLGEESLSRLKEEVRRYALDHTFKETAKKFGIHHSTVSGWVKARERVCQSNLSLLRSLSGMGHSLTTLTGFPTFLTPALTIIYHISLCVIVDIWLTHPFPCIST